MDVRVGLYRKLHTKELMVLNCSVGEDFWESLGLQGYPTTPSEGNSVLNIHWKDWCWSWNFNTLGTWCEELTHWKRPWCWQRLKAGGEGEDRGWDGWMASPTQWTWVWVNSRSWWWTGRPGMLQSMGLQRVRHDWATELNWTELNWKSKSVKKTRNLSSRSQRLLYLLILGRTVNAKPGQEIPWPCDSYTPEIGYSECRKTEHVPRVSDQHVSMCGRDMKSNELEF